MRARLLRLGVPVAALFAINVAARLVVRLVPVEDPAAQDRITLAAYLAIGLTLLVLAIVRGRLRALGTVVAELAVVAGLGCLSTVLLGPLVSGEAPFAGGAGIFFNQVWQYAGFGGGGALIGLLLLIMVGRDYRSQSLRRFAEAKLAKPRRAVRR